MKYKVYHAHFDRSPMGYLDLIPRTEVYLCDKRFSNIRMLIRHCPYYLSIHQTELKGGKTNQMKIDNIPSEKGRVELNDLPQTVDLKAIEEKTVEASTGKSGGLIITFELRDGRQFPQKYTKVSGAKLVEAMENLKLTDTTDLQDAWFTYKMTIMRIGLPRMIPVKLAREQN